LESVLEYALAYASAGWKVIPLQWVREDGSCSCGKADCSTSRGKHPLTAHGKKDGSTDAAVITGWWTRWPNANVGIVTGIDTGLMVFDIDPRNGGDVTYEHLLETGHSMDESVAVVTGGGGKHIYLRCESNYADHPRIAKGIDLKACGGYVVAPPSVTASRYGFLDEESPFETGVMPPPPPKWLTDMLSKAREPAAGKSGSDQRRYSIELNEVEAAEIRSALAHLAHTSAVDDRDDWIRVGMALHSTLARGAFELWAEWSAVSVKYDPGDLRRNWVSFDAYRNNGITLGTLWQMAEEAGWERPAPTVVVRDKQEVEAERKSLTMPEHLYHVPGRLADFVEWTNDTAIKRQPKIAIAAAITLGASVMSQRYRWGYARTSIVQIGVAPTSSGKEHPRTCIKKAMAAAGLADRMTGEDIKSGSALWRAAAANPRITALMDEYGLYMQSVTRRDASPHKREVAECLMKLATSYSSTVNGAVYADSKANPRADIAYPCINLLGTTTVEPLAAALTGSHVIDGLLNRHLVVMSETPLPKPNRWAHDAPPPARLIEWMVSLDSWRPPGAGDMVGIMPETPIDLTADMGAQQAIDAFDDEVEARRQRMMDDRDSQAGLDALWGRAVEHAQKVAMVLAGSSWDGKSTPRVTTLHAKWAVDYVRHCLDVAEELVRTHVSDSDFERVLKAVTRVIDRGGQAGATERELVRAVTCFRSLKPNERSAALRALEVEGYKLVTVPSGYACGRPRRAWLHERWIGGEAA
jgi:hypothetical protein